MNQPSAQQKVEGRRRTVKCGVPYGLVLWDSPASLHLSTKQIPPFPPSPAYKPPKSWGRPLWPAPKAPHVGNPIAEAGQDRRHAGTENKAVTGRQRRLLPNKQRLGKVDQGSERIRPAKNSEGQSVNRLAKRTGFPSQRQSYLHSPQSGLRYITGYHVWLNRLSRTVQERLDHS